MEVRVSEWEKELDELSVHFGKLCKCRKKSLSAEDDTLVSYVANKQLEMVKRVNIFLYTFSKSVKLPYLIKAVQGSYEIMHCFCAPQKPSLLSFKATLLLVTCLRSCFL